jgi:hypothetical protein
MSKNVNTGLTTLHVQLEYWIGLRLRLYVYCIKEKPELKDDITGNTMHFEKEVTETELH